jgi:hypothetical protein
MAKPALQRVVRGVLFLQLSYGSPDQPVDRIHETTKDQQGNQYFPESKFSAKHAADCTTASAGLQKKVSGPTGVHW